MNKMILNRLTMLAVTLMASMACFAQGKGGDATGWGSTFGPNYQELSYTVTTNAYHVAIVTGFASYVVEKPAIMDDPETYAPGDDNLQIEKNTIIINHFMSGGTKPNVYIPSVAANAFADVAATLASKIYTIKIDFKNNSQSNKLTNNKPVVIGSSAFSSLTSVATVYNYTPGEFVQPIPTDAFASKVFKKATLIVPEGSAQKYANTDGWKKFYKIKNGATGTILGDINNDGDIDALDLNALRQAVLKRQYSLGADINGDGDVDALDLTKMRQVILRTY